MKMITGGFFFCITAWWVSFKIGSSARAFRVPLPYDSATLVRPEVENTVDLTYVSIYIPEGERANIWGRPIYTDLVQALLREHDAPGMTVFRAFEGLDAKRHIQNSHSDYAQDSLPMVLEMITSSDTSDLISTIERTLDGHVYCVTAIPAVDMKSSEPTRTEELRMKETVTLRVYMLETDRHRYGPLYHTLVLAARTSGLLWVNVQRGVEGFGSDHVLRRSLFFRSQCPVVVEVTGAAQEIHEFVTDHRDLIEAASGPAVVLRGTLVSGTA